MEDRAFRQPRVVIEPANGMIVTEHWIPMRDGVHLAANLFTPDGPEAAGPLPSVLEYLPYRKDDGMLKRDYDLYSYVVPRGYLGARVDIRGTGRSEGRLPDREYSEQEQLDCEDVIAWLASRPWSTGHVGMWGISWGGFNSIHMAMRASRPEALKAIIAIDAADDLFQDDVHYIDGMMHVDEYVVMIDQLNAMTRAPDFPLDEASLAERFDSEPWLLRWLKEQRDGEFWRRDSLAPNYERLGIPALLIGGYLDGYRDSVPRMLERCTGVPVKAIMGPWNHSFPHAAEPGPEIEWRAEAVRWWDRWLKGVRNGVEDEPKFAVYVREWHPPGTERRDVPGAWRLEENWPLDRGLARPLYLGSDFELLDERPGKRDSHELSYVPTSGTNAGQWWGELLPDQRAADAFSLVYRTPPLERDQEILGFPLARIFVSSEAPLAHWFARLSDEAPDGRVTLVTGAGVNGAHRESAFDPEPLEPGLLYPLDVEMHFTSWVFPKGHRIRIAVSNAVWPMIWPTPYSMATSLAIGGDNASHVVLPVVPHEDRPLPDFPPPSPRVAARGLGSEGAILPLVWSVARDEGDASSTFDWSSTSALSFPWGKQEFMERLQFHASDSSPAEAFATGEAVTDVYLRDCHLRWRALLDLRSDARNFYYRYTRQLTRDDELMRTRSWEETIPRDHQ